MSPRKLTWLKLYADPTKDGSGLRCCGLASAPHWDGEYRSVTEPPTRVWAYYGNPPSAHWTNLHEHPYQSWVYEIVDQSSIDTDAQICLLTAAAMSGGF